MVRTEKSLPVGLRSLKSTASCSLSVGLAYAPAMRVAALTAAAIALLAAGAAVANIRQAPAGATAQCRDGSYSFSLHHSGTCSSHGGVAQRLDGSASPAGTAATSGSEADASGGTGGCGVERWSIKTMSDPGAGSVRLIPKLTTVAALRSIPAPASLGTTRIAPVETTTYRLVANLEEFKVEADSDVHLVIADPHTGGTMIVEFPARSCLGHASAAIKQRIAAARLALIRSCGSPSSLHFTAIRGRATVTGVGFFDFQHGQSGRPERDRAPPGTRIHRSLHVGAFSRL
jgi:hypothetical protein